MLNCVASSPTYNRLESFLKSSGNGILYILATMTAKDVTKVQWRISLGSNFSMGVGGLLGSFQNGFPSFVLASKGYVYKSCLMSFL